eukprot:CAMPEP_0168306042 /NCGR_PEP_ID=MMETSP0142_2-20121227/52312_1 /TAXON_ID=44445 /ORGANISM="Pseudo-nitzschia australis, Strain 10249 10 AB" /LENGTH=463 /DNA_ID=CAMNT_0008257687 /DNA_START=89 /DNA_END=1477 /DNA_ORIENTATION=-
MVDFEIKLQDNKVAEWSIRYMDYAALKKILKRAKISQLKYLNLKKKTNVGLGRDIPSTNKKDGDCDGISVDTLSLPTLYSQDDLASLYTEETALLSRSRKSIEDLTGRRIFGKNAFANISGLFPEDRLKDALEDLDDQVLAFATCFHDEEKKVKSFYYETLDDLEERLEFMTTSVARAFSINVDEISGEIIASPQVDGHQRISPFVTKGKGHRKTVSMDNVMEVFMQTVIGDEIGNNTRSNRRSKTSRKQFNRNDFDEPHSKTIPRHPRSNMEIDGNFVNDNRTKNRHKKKGHLRRVTNLQLGHLLQEDDDEEELHFQSVDLDGKRDGNIHSNPELEERRAADAEMIKRFLISQYRTAKYLHNYAMLNITGFVKIAKKFDKTIPAHAGKFKSSLESRNMMDDACDIEALTKKYEVYYANWFCEGDVRASKVQMLSKQGDNLELDWSQLQLGYRMGICAVLAVW